MKMLLVLIAISALLAFVAYRNHAEAVVTRYQLQECIREREHLKEVTVADLAKIHELNSRLSELMQRLGAQ